jgi:hypothetical protein
MRQGKRQARQGNSFLLPFCTFKQSVHEVTKICWKDGTDTSGVYVEVDIVGTRPGPDTGLGKRKGDLCSADVCRGKHEY